MRSALLANFALIHNPFNSVSIFGFTNSVDMLELEVVIIINGEAKTAITHQSGMTEFVRSTRGGDYFFTPHVSVRRRMPLRHAPARSRKPRRRSGRRRSKRKYRYKRTRAKYAKKGYSKELVNLITEIAVEKSGEQRAAVADRHWASGWPDVNGDPTVQVVPSALITNTPLYYDFFAAAVRGSGLNMREGDYLTPKRLIINGTVSFAPATGDILQRPHEIHLWIVQLIGRDMTLPTLSDLFIPATRVGFAGYASGVGTMMDMEVWTGKWRRALTPFIDDAIILDRKTIRYNPKKIGVFSGAVPIYVPSERQTKKIFWDVNLKRAHKLQFTPGDASAGSAKIRQGRMLLVATSNLEQDVSPHQMKMVYREHFLA